MMRSTIVGMLLAGLIGVGASAGGRVDASGHYQVTVDELKRGTVSDAPAGRISAQPLRGSASANFQPRQPLVISPEMLEAEGAALEMGEVVTTGSPAQSILPLQLAAQTHYVPGPGFAAADGPAEVLHVEPAGGSTVVYHGRRTPQRHYEPYPGYHDRYDYDRYDHWRHRRGYREVAYWPGPSVVYHRYYYHAHPWRPYGWSAWRYRGWCGPSSGLSVRLHMSF